MSSTPAYADPPDPTRAGGPDAAAVSAARAGGAGGASTAASAGGTAGAGARAVRVARAAGAGAGWNGVLRAESAPFGAALGPVFGSGGRPPAGAEPGAEGLDAEWAGFAWSAAVRAGLASLGAYRGGAAASAARGARKARAQAAVQGARALLAAPRAREAAAGGRADGEPAGPVSASRALGGIPASAAGAPRRAAARRRRALAGVAAVPVPPSAEHADCAVHARPAQQARRAEAALSSAGRGSAGASACRRAAESCPDSARSAQPAAGGSGSASPAFGPGADPFLGSIPKAGGPPASASARGILVVIMYAVSALGSAVLARCPEEPVPCRRSSLSAARVRSAAGTGSPSSRRAGRSTRSASRADSRSCVPGASGRKWARTS